MNTEQNAAKISTVSSPAPTRDAAVDNLRCGVVVLVILYHILYLFNSQGVVSTIGVQGYPALDTLLYFVYPWFMALLFLLAGVSARYSITRRGGRRFWQERLRRLLVPAVGAFFLTDWLTTLVLSQYVDIFGGNGATLPGPMKYLIYCMAGTGPLWFVHVLLVLSGVLLVIRRVDKAGRLDALAAKIEQLPLPWLLLGVVPLWAMAQVGNLPVLVMYRFGIYGWCFLLGYYLFSRPGVIAKLHAGYRPLLAAALACGVAYTAYYFGQNYANPPVLQSLFTNAYAWLMMLALLGTARACLNRETAFTRYLRPRSFAFFVLHYPVLSVSAWGLATRLALPLWLVYPLLAVEMAVVLPLLYELVRRIPGLRFWLLGLRKGE